MSKTHSLIEYVKQQKIDVQGICLATVSAAVFAVLLWKFTSGSGSSKKSKSKSHKKKNKKEKVAALTHEMQIENIHLRYKNEFEDRVNNILGAYNPDDEKSVYEKKYCNEMLLKLLIELDGVDLVSEEPEKKAILKAKRKAVIKEIQTQLKKLDTLV